MANTSLFVTQSERLQLALKLAFSHHPDQWGGVFEPFGPKDFGTERATLSSAALFAAMPEKIVYAQGKKFRLARYFKDHAGDAKKMARAIGGDVFHDAMAQSVRYVADLNRFAQDFANNPADPNMIPHAVALGILTEGDRVRKIYAVGRQPDEDERITAIRKKLLPLTETVLSGVRRRGDELERTPSLGVHNT